MKDESGEQFVAYFLPTEETMTKREKDKQSGVFPWLPVFIYSNIMYSNILYTEVIYI